MLTYVKTNNVFGTYLLSSEKQCKLEKHQNTTEMHFKHNPSLFYALGIWLAQFWIRGLGF